MSKITHEQARENLNELLKHIEQVRTLDDNIKANYLGTARYINQQEHTPLIHFYSSNHFRNAFYNAPIGTIENEIANKLNELEEYKISDTSKENSSINYYNELKELKRDVKRYFELDAMNWDLAHNEDIRENRKQYKERILSKVGNE